MDDAHERRGLHPAHLPPSLAKRWSSLMSWVCGTLALAWHRHQCKVWTGQKAGIEQQGDWFVAQGMT